eukprot:Opistho-2@25789
MPVQHPDWIAHFSSCGNTSTSAEGISVDEAFGSAPDCLGIILVSNVPNFVERRKTLLPLAAQYAALPEDIKAKTTHEESKYSFGWSHGKEKFNGIPDIAKGSYYANPQYDNPTSDKKLIASFPEYCHPNIWPTEDFPLLAPAFKSLGSLIVDVGILVSKKCDQYMASLFPEQFSSQPLATNIQKSMCTKARLLHYFPRDTSEAMPDVSEHASWCGWHLDHSSLTGLTSAMFINSEGKEVPNPDPKAGLYIRNRGNRMIKVNIPADHLAFQMGEATQIRTGGRLRATPHCVHGAGGPAAVGVSRNTLAVFMQPNWDDVLTTSNALFFLLLCWQMASPRRSRASASRATHRAKHSPNSATKSSRSTTKPLSRSRGVLAVLVYLKSLRARAAQDAGPTVWDCAIW